MCVCVSVSGGVPSQVAVALARPKQLLVHWHILNSPACSAEATRFAKTICNMHLLWYQSLCSGQIQGVLGPM